MKKDDSKTLPKDKGANAPSLAINLDAKKHRTGLSVDEWKRLQDSDRSTLTPTQVRQLEEANKTMVEFANRLAEQYDFSPVISAIKAIQSESFIEQTASMLAATDKLTSSMVMPIQQLVKVQKNLALSTSVLSQTLIKSASAFNLAQSLFKDLDRFNSRFLRSFQVNIPSLGFGFAQISATEIIDVEVLEVRDLDGQVEIKAEAVQVQRVEEYELVSKGTIQMLLTNLQSTQREMREIKKLILEGKSSPHSRLESADITIIREDSILKLQGYEVPVKRTSRQAGFCELFFESADKLHKKWSVIDIMAFAFGEHTDADTSEERLASKVKGYVNALNSKIAAYTEGKYMEFFILFENEVYVNPGYLASTVK